MRDPVVIVPWRPDWADQFVEARDAILSLFQSGEALVEHVGSTAVPGLAAKPIVDMMLGVRRLVEFERRIPALEAAGWEYIPEHEAVLPDRRFLARPKPRPRSHHLHAVELGTRFWNEHLAFRDHLRAHPDEARAYGELKRELAKEHGRDREAYTEAKTDFVRGILARAAAR